jgi:hypothetical protein
MPMRTTDDERPCPRCRQTGRNLTWQEFKGGSRHIRAACAGCGRYLGFVEQTPANVAAADNPAPPAADGDGLLRLLVELDEAGVQLPPGGIAKLARNRPDLVRRLRQARPSPGTGGAP